MIIQLINNSTQKKFTNVKLTKVINSILFVQIEIIGKCHFILR